MPAGLSDIKRAFEKLRYHDKKVFEFIEKLAVSEDVDANDRKERDAVWHRIKSWDTFSKMLKEKSIVGKLAIRATLRLVVWWLKYPTVDDAQFRAVNALVALLGHQFTQWYDEVGEINRGDVFGRHLNVLLEMKKIYELAPSVLTHTAQQFYEAHLKLLSDNVHDLILQPNHLQQLRELRTYTRPLALQQNPITGILWRSRRGLLSKSLPAIKEGGEPNGELPPVSATRRHSCPSFFNRYHALPSIVTASPENPLSLSPSHGASSL